MSELRWGVQPPFKGLKPTPTVKSEPRRDADEILFENLQHLHEIGAITINDDEVLNESLFPLARTGVITVNTAKSIQTGKKIQTSGSNSSLYLADVHFPSHTATVARVACILAACMRGRTAAL